MPASVLIIEDEPSVSELLSVNLQYAGYYPIQSHDAHSATALLAEVLPDLIVLDWMLPGTSGLVFLRRLRTNDRTKGIPVIMLTARVDEDDLVNGLEAGADDYVAKPFSPKELIARIKAVLRRQPVALDSGAVSISGLTLDPETRRVHAHHNGSDVPVRLGPTEFKLLHFFMSRPERVHSRSLVVEQVWGNHSIIGERTVDVHIKRLRAALKPVGYGGIIETIRGSGYMLSRSQSAQHLGTAA